MGRLSKLPRNLKLFKILFNFLGYKTQGKNKTYKQKQKKHIKSKKHMNTNKNSNAVAPLNRGLVKQYSDDSLFPTMDFFHDEFDSFVEKAFNLAWSNPAWVTKRNYRLYDVKENDKSYTVEVEIPGFKKSEIKLQVVDGSVQLVAQNNRGTYSKTWSLTGADLDKVTSKLEDGILTINIPKIEEVQPKIINIQEN